MQLLDGSKGAPLRYYRGIHSGDALVQGRAQYLSSPFSSSALTHAVGAKVC